MAVHGSTVAALRKALEAAGVELSTKMAAAQAFGNRRTAKGMAQGLDKGLQCCLGILNFSAG
jgi:hypothetical protein